MRIAVGADHGGFELKNEVAAMLRDAGHRVIDKGAYELDPADDYPDFAEAVTQALRDGKAERGILVCGSGIGASVAANKVPGIRASICHDTYSARQGVEHDNLNILCLGARVIGPELASELVDAFIEVSFSGEERHRRRLAKVQALEKRFRSDAA